MLQFFDTLTDDSGNALLGATVAVTSYPSGSAVTIYQSNGTTQPVANATVIADITGQVNFFAPDGAYILTYSYKGTQYKIRSPVQLIDPMGFVAATDTGAAANVYAVAGSQYPAQLYPGMKLEIKAAHTNSGASTMAWQGGSAQPIVQPGGAPLVAGMIQTNGLVRFEWDGAEFQLIGSQSQPFYAITAAEITAGVTITNSNYPELDARRYGLATAASAATNTTALQAGVSVLAQYQDGELLVAEGVVASINQVLFNVLTKFNFRCDGILVSNAAQPGTPFTDSRTTYAGVYTPLKFTTCSQFKVYGKGYVQPGFVEPVFLSSCFDFDFSLDCRGNGTNSTLSGFYIRYCYQFRLRDMTIDSITAQNMNNATEVYYSWLNNVQIWDSYDFLISRVISRRAGMNGFYPASNCYEFSIQECTAEFNSGSGIQLAWSSFGVFPVRFSISNNTLRYNQADGIDCNNTQGSPSSIYATFMGNIHAYNGWINCNPANAAGSDGSGVGTFENVNNFEAVGNTVSECANSGIYISSCSQWRVTHNTVIKSNTGTASYGAFISSGTSGSFAYNDFKTPSSLSVLDMQSTNDVTVNNNSFDGLLTFANGSYPGCRFANNRCTAYAQTLVQFDWIENDFTASNASQNGLYIINPGVRVVRNNVTATGIGIVCPSVNYCDISWNTVVVSGTAEAIYVNAAECTNVYGNTATSVTAAAIHILGTSDQTTLALNKASSTSGNSLRVESTCTLTAKWANVAIAGATSYAGTYTINY